MNKKEKVTEERMNKLEKKLTDLEIAFASHSTDVVNIRERLRRQDEYRRNKLKIESAKESLMDIRSIEMITGAAKKKQNDRIMKIVAGEIPYLNARMLEAAKEGKNSAEYYWSDNCIEELIGKDLPKSAFYQAVEKALKEAGYTVLGIFAGEILKLEEGAPDGCKVTRMFGVRVIWGW